MLARRVGRPAAQVLNLILLHTSVATDRHLRFGLGGNADAAER
jgi:hypothetical protein